ncbi:MAG: sterol desaturase family protein [Bacteroidota bacterium]
MVALFVIVFLRYLIVSGLYHYSLRIRWREQLRERIFHYQPERGSQIRREIYSSLLVSFIFALFGISVLWLWDAGYTKIYLAPNERSYIWLIAGPVIFLFAQETYYYWTHRWMHLPKIYPYVHKRHHESIETTAWTAFSFSPLEAIIQAIFLPVIVLVLPLQAYLFLGLLAWMTLSATINHAGIEIFPASWAQTPFLRKLIGATHHDLHHKQASTNFGLYFTYWDEWMGTESKLFSKRFKQFTTNKHPDKR